MIEAVIIALIISKIKGYSLKPFFKSWTIYPILIFEAINAIITASIIILLL